MNSIAQIKDDRSSNVSVNIEREIERLIRQKHFSQGEKLPTEHDLCIKHAASRTAVREALNRLKSRGLIEIKKGSGIYVSELSSKSAIDMLNIYFEMSDDSDLLLNTIRARKYFEPEIAAQAAMNRTEEDLVAIGENLNRLRQCPISDVELETELDREFHMLIAATAANPVVKIIMEPIFNLILKHNLTIYGKDSATSDSERKQTTLKFHLNIYEAIKNKDSREAYYQMRESLVHSEKLYKQQKLNLIN